MYRTLDKSQDILNQKNLESFKIVGNRMRSSNPRKVSKLRRQKNSDKISKEVSKKSQNIYLSEFSGVMQ